MNLKERLAQFGNALPFMEGREKGDVKVLMGENITLVDYGFMKDPKKDEEYSCFIIKENKTEFFFGGMVLTKHLKELDHEGYHDEIIKDGIKLKFSEKKGSENTYTNVEYLK